MATANLFNREVRASKSPRNAFDLSYCTLFNSPAGQILPCYVEEVKAGDKLKLGLSNITRTRPLNTSAFMAFDEKVDFWYVPYCLLWTAYEQWRLMQTYPHSSTDLSRVGDQELLPCTSYSIFPDYWLHMPVLNYLDSNFLSNTSNPNACLCDFLKILDLLGYGSFLDKKGPFSSSTIGHSTVFGTTGDGANFKAALSTFYTDLGSSTGYFNYFRLAAFQCIYMHHYRNEEYENLDPSYYNCDSLFLSDLSPDNSVPTSSVNGPRRLTYNSGTVPGVSVPCINFSKLVTPRFKNWRKDVFNSVKPNSGFAGPLISGFQNNSPQSGSDFSWPTNTSFTVVSPDGTTPADQTNNPYLAPFSSLSYSRGYMNIQHGSPYIPMPVENAGSSDQPFYYTNLIPQNIRNLMAQDKFVRAAIYADKDYESQMKAIFGENVVEPHQPRYLGSYSSTVSISDVTATSAGNDGDTSDLSSSVLGQIAGKGYNSDGKDTIFSREFDKDGIVMGVHYIMPRNNYDSSRINRFNLKLSRFDYFYPQFDGLGLQPVYMFERNFSFFDYGSSNPEFGSLFGYAPRFYEYKQRTNEVHGSFQTGQPDYDWTLSNNTFALVSGNCFWSYKIHPYITNRIFTVAYDGSDQTCPFQHFYQFNVTRVSNMEIYGTPNI